MRTEDKTSKRLAKRSKREIAKRLKRDLKRSGDADASTARKKAYVFFRTMYAGRKGERSMHWYVLDLKNGEMLRRLESGEELKDEAEVSTGILGKWIHPFSDVHQPKDSTVVSLGSCIYCLGGTKSQFNSFLDGDSNNVYCFNTTPLLERRARVCTAQEAEQVGDGLKWLPCQGMINCRRKPRVVVVCDKIFVSGGFETGDFDAWAEVYDPKNDLWAPLNKSDEGLSIYSLLNPDGKKPFHFSMNSVAGSSSIIFSSETATWSYDVINLTIEKTDQQLVVLSPPLDRLNLVGPVLTGRKQYMIHPRSGGTVYGCEIGSQLSRLNYDALLRDLTYEHCVRFALLRMDEFVDDTEDSQGLHMIIHGGGLPFQYNEVHLRSVRLYGGSQAFKTTQSFLIPSMSTILDGLIMESK